VRTNAPWTNVPPRKVATFSWGDEGRVCIVSSVATCIRINEIFDYVQEGADENLLRAVEKQIVARDACNVHPYPITPRMVCAGVPEGGKGFSARDGGDPLYIKKSGKLIGLACFGTGSAAKGYPDVYANVAEKEIHDFIQSELKQVAVGSSSNGSEV